MSAISAHDLYKIFGRKPQDALARLRQGVEPQRLRESGATPAVIDASFDVAEGEIFVVMGLSGSGKSTLIRMVNGLYEPTAGHVEVYGENVTAATGEKLREIRRTRVSMVFQHFALFPHRTVADNAAYGLKIQGVPAEARRRKAVEALRMCGLEGWEDSRPGELSGGMKQRVGLARALAADTDVLLMDEAFSALDPLIRREMQDKLLELQRELGKTILFITHDLNEAMRLGDRIAMMRNGRIVQTGSATDILTRPADDYVARFIADVDRSRVLTAASVMETTANGDGPAGGDTVGADVVLADLFDRVASAQRPLAVVKDGRRVGVLTREQLLRALGESPAVGSADVPDSPSDEPEGAAHA